MTAYKVPQDVEADDKLIGPFSFRQFIYLIIVAIAMGIAWGLSQIFIPLAIIPLPVIIFFGALALPLRKDQPMEVYLAAIVSFYLKPRKRLWQPDGIQSLVEITVPKVREVLRAKNLSEDEAQRRLSYLADIVDTGGWAVRGVGMPDTNSAMINDVFYEAQQTEDILDDSGGVSRTFDSMISQSDARHRQEIVARIHQTPEPEMTSPPIPNPYANLAPAPTDEDPQLVYNPYPTSIHQAVINPLGSRPSPQPTPAATSAPTPEPIKPTSTTSEKVVSPDIINLANNSDLSIETIAHEAQRIRQKEKKLSEDEVVISLR